MQFSKPRFASLSLILLLVMLLAHWTSVCAASSHPILRVSIDSSCEDLVAINEECIISIRVENSIGGPRVNVSGVVKFHPMGCAEIIGGKASSSDEGLFTGWAVLEPGKVITLTKIRVKFLKLGVCTITAILEYIAETGVRGRFSGLSKIIRVVKPEIDVTLSPDSIVMKPGSIRTITYHISIYPPATHLTLNNIDFETPQPSLTLTYTRIDPWNGEIIIKVGDDTFPGDYDVILKFNVDDSVIVKRLHIRVEEDMITRYTPTPDKLVIITLLVLAAVTTLILIRRIKGNTMTMLNDDTKLLPD